MAHELFGLPERMHDVLTLALVNGALTFVLPLLLAAWLRWRDNQWKKGTNKQVHRRMRVRRRRMRRR